MSGPLYGLLAEFPSAEALLTAAQKVHSRGYRRVEAYTPYPVDGLIDALGVPRSRALPWAVFVTAVVVGGLMFWTQFYTVMWNYPINVGGKPYNSWPAYVISSLVLAVLAGGATAALATLFENGLPLYHPLFNVPGFDLAGRDRFYLCIEARDRRFDPEAVRALFRVVGAIAIEEVRQ